MGQIAAEVRDITRIERIGEANNSLAGAIFGTCSNGVVFLALQVLTPTSEGWGWMTRWSLDRWALGTRAVWWGDSRLWGRGRGEGGTGTCFGGGELKLLLVVGVALAWN